MRKLTEHVLCGDVHNLTLRVDSKAYQIHNNLCVCVCVCVCVQEEREREREGMCTCVCA